MRKGEKNKKRPQTADGRPRPERSKAKSKDAVVGGQRSAVGHFTRASAMTENKNMMP